MLTAGSSGCGHVQRQHDDDDDSLSDGNSCDGHYDAHSVFHKAFIDWFAELLLNDSLKGSDWICPIILVGIIMALLDLKPYRGFDISSIITLSSYSRP